MTVAEGLLISAITQCAIGPVFSSWAASGFFVAMVVLVNVVRLNND